LAGDRGAFFKKSPPGPLQILETNVNCMLKNHFFQRKN
jgi:hypothetical protein